MLPVAALVTAAAAAAVVAAAVVAAAACLPLDEDCGRGGVMEDCCEAVVADAAAFNTRERSLSATPQLYSEAWEAGLALTAASYAPQACWG